METNTLFDKNRPVFAAGILYTVTALIVVISAWVINLHRFDLDLTISRYVALRQWTAVMYLIVAAVMVTLVAIHLIKSKMWIVKKILYFLAFACIFGCAVFPFNPEWSSLSSNLHNYFAYGLMFVALVTFVLTAVKPINREQKVFSKIAIGYALFFITCFVIIKWEFFIGTIFMWENTFIYMFLVELMTEYKDSKVLSIFAKKFPFVGIAGMILSLIIYLAAPINGHSLDDNNPPFWNMVKLASVILLISALILTLSIITYSLYRPLSEKRKAPDIVLRIVLTPLAVVTVITVSYIMLLCFYGAGG